jgi:hypothetical protein
MVPKRQRTDKLDDTCGRVIMAKRKKIAKNIHSDPIQGKPPLPEFEVDEELVKQLGVMEYFAGLNIESPLFDEMHKAIHDNTTHPEEWAKVMKDPNLVILYRQLRYLELYEEESIFKKALINLKKLDIVLFRFNPWYRSRRGWDMWWFATHQNPDSYYPLGWEMHYDPRLWYRIGEPIRKPGTETLPNFTNFYPKPPEEKAEESATESPTNVV